jgi:hypothetical protein
MSQREFLVYGRATLQKVVKSGNNITASVVKIGIDQDSEELEKLIALVIAIKGSHDYQSGSQPP